MIDQYASYKTIIFIDSNVILEANPLKSLPWNEVDPLGPILIMLTPTLLSEVDSKKKDGRLATRAREFNRLIAPIAQTGQPIKLLDAPIQVDVMIATCHKINWDAYDDLASNEGDARIIAEILNTKNIPDEQKIFVSHDIAPLFMAQRHKIRTLHVSDAWLPKPEPSPHEKEIAKLKRQIADYGKTEPEISVKISIPDQPIEIYRVDAFSDDEIKTYIQQIISANPKPEQDRYVLLSSLEQRDYTIDSRYEEYIKKTIPNFLKKCHVNTEQLYGQVPISFSIKNSGKIAAEHLYINVQILGGWFNRKPIDTLVYPMRPRIKSRLDSLNISTLASYIPKAYKSIGRHDVDVRTPRKDAEFTAECENFRQGQEWVYRGVFWLDPNYDKEHTIIIKITSSNLRGENVTPFPIKTIISFAKYSELVNIRNGKVKKIYPIKKIIEDAFNSQDFDAFEIEEI